MKRLTLIIAIALAMGAVAEPPPDAKVSVSAVFVQAMREGREDKDFGPGLEDVKQSMADLKFDTFRKIRSEIAVIPFGEEKTMRINDRYTLLVKPLSKDAEGRIRVRFRVQEKRGKTGDRESDKEKVSDAIATTVALVPGDRFRLGGCKLGTWELVIIVSAREPERGPLSRGAKEGSQSDGRTPLPRSSRALR